MTKNLKKVLRKLKVGSIVTEETNPINFEKAKKHLAPKVKAAPSNALPLEHG